MHLRAKNLLKSGATPSYLLIFVDIWKEISLNEMKKLLSRFVFFLIEILSCHCVHGISYLQNICQIMQIDRLSIISCDLFCIRWHITCRCHVIYHKKIILTLNLKDDQTKTFIRIQDRLSRSKIIDKEWIKSDWKPPSESTPSLSRVYQSN